MPRVGMNPARNRESGFLPTRVTAAILTHVPHDAGYFEHRFESLKLCIESLIHNTDPACDILIFDNASSPQVVDYLRTVAGREQNSIPDPFQPEYRQDRRTANDLSSSSGRDHCV